MARFGSFDRRMTVGLIAMAAIASATIIAAIVATRALQQPGWATVVASIALVLLAAIGFALVGIWFQLHRADSDPLAVDETTRSAEQLARARNESHETYRRILERTLDAVITMDAGGRISTWNPAAEKMFGWIGSEIIGSRLHEMLLAPSDRGVFLSGLEEFSISGRASILDRRIELSGLRRDGAEFPIEIALFAIQNGESWFGAVIRDISDRRRIEGEIHARAEEFRATFECVGIGHVQIEVPSGRFLSVNPKMCEITAFSANELIGRTFTSLLPPRSPESERIRLDALARGETGLAPIETHLVRGDGPPVSVHVTATLIHEADGRPRRVLAVVQDLSELRQAQSALQATEKRFQLMADSAAVLVWMSGPDRQFTWFNRPWKEFTGRTMTQELGYGWMDGVHPNDLERCKATYAAAFAQRRPFTMEYRLRRYDDEWRWMLDNAVPLYGERGEFNGYIGSCIDISDRKRAEEQRERVLEGERIARNEAERISRIKDEFLATLSHELRTPLQAMLGWTRLLGAEHLDSAQARHGLQIIERNVTLQKRLIEDLLDMSRIVQGKMQLEILQVDPEAVVEAAIEVVRPSADAKSIRISTGFEPGIGSIPGDAHRLQQAIWNLLSNAIKFTPPGGEIEVRTSRAADHIEISVRDTGQGITFDFLPFVFERFRQQDASTTRRQGGLGIGLAIVRNLIELHGGRVLAVSSGEGQGATFTIVLPVHAAPAGISAEKPHPREGIAPSRRRARIRPIGVNGLRVLVVDDERDACELLQRILTEQGAEVVAASTVPDALVAFRRFRPQVLVSDIGMPGHDGYELIRTIREMERGEEAAIPAIALTAFAREEDRALALEAGFQLHLSKPVEPAELSAAIARLARDARDAASHPAKPSAPLGDAPAAA